jgi:hypothetical protein
MGDAAAGTTGTADLIWVEELAEKRCIQDTGTRAVVNMTDNHGLSSLLLS